MKNQDAAQVLYERLIPLQEDRDFEKEINTKAKALYDNYILPRYVLIGSHAFMSMFVKHEYDSIVRNLPSFQSSVGELEFLIHPTDKNSIMVIPDNKNLYSTAQQLAFNVPEATKL